MFLRCLCLCLCVSVSLGVCVSGCLGVWVSGCLGVWVSGKLGNSIWGGGFLFLFCYVGVGVRLGARCGEGVRLEPTEFPISILVSTLSYLVSFGGILAKYFRIFGPLKKPVFAEDLERNKISALNGNILAIYIGDSFSEYWR